MSLKCTVQCSVPTISSSPLLTSARGSSDKHFTIQGAECIEQISKVLFHIRFMPVKLTFDTSELVVARSLSMKALQLKQDFTRLLQLKCG